MAVRQIVPVTGNGVQELPLCKVNRTIGRVYGRLATSQWLLRTSTLPCRKRVRTDIARL